MQLSIKSKVFQEMSDEEFTAFCEEQENIRIERTSDKTVNIMSPSHPESSEISGEIFFQLKLWNNSTKAGKVFESSAGFFLPNGAMLSAGCSFVSNKKWAEVKSESPKILPHVVPEFVVEVRSPSDSLIEKKNKMEEWIRNGALLGWLVDIENRHIYIYDVKKEIMELYTVSLIHEVKYFGAMISGEEVLPGFSFDSRVLNTKS